MTWDTNEKIPLDEATQVAICDVVAKAAGVDPDKPGEEGEKLGYIKKDKLVEARTRIGTCCGAKGNIFSQEMVDLFLQSEHIVMCWFTETKRSEVAAMAVKGFTFAQADEMSRLAKEAGCVLKPDVVNVLGQQWMMFETE